MISRRSLVSLLPVMASGCGWHPVYAPAPGADTSAAQVGLSRISVALIPERVGQLLRLALQERFERFGTGQARQYDLTVTFSIGQEGIAIRQDSTSTRTRLIGTANWTLAALDARHTSLTSGTARDVEGYDIVDEEYFASDLQSDVVKKRIAEAVADQVTRQLAVFFNHRAAAG
jgi:LPS-assembly lipoprotein